jgi:hypothetical protein
LVKDRVLATNRHVLGVLTYGSEVLAPGRARVVFKQEDGKVNETGDVVAIQGVAEKGIHPNLDMVLLKVSAQCRPSVPLATTPIIEGERVVTIGFPAEDKKNNPLFLAAVFNGRFGVKRAALGEVLDGIASPAFFHDCSTAQGNSGSPIFLLGTARAAGIHRAGFFMYRNEAVDAENLLKFVEAAGSEAGHG